jgi:hypothetical protein
VAAASPIAIHARNCSSYVSCSISADPIRSSLHRAITGLWRPRKGTPVTSAHSRVPEARRRSARIIETGSQPGNLDRIARAEADATAIDCVTFAFWSHYRPDAARQVRVLAQTPPSPAIPFVTSAATSTATVEVVRAALRKLAHDPCYATARRGLLVTDITDLPIAAYRGLLDYEHEAAELGYPVLI